MSKRNEEQIGKGIAERLNRGEDPTNRKPMDDAQADAPKWTPKPCPFCTGEVILQSGGEVWHKRHVGCIVRDEFSSPEYWQRVEEIGAALASPRATGSEPVAWRSRWRNTESGEAEPWRPENDPPLARGPVGIMTFDVEPLYDHPSPSLASASADEELRQIDLAFGNVSALDGLTRAEKAAKCVKMLAALNAPAELPVSSPVPESPSMTLGATGDRISVRFAHKAVPESPSPDDFDAQVMRFHASGCAAELEGLKPSDPDFWRRVLRGVRGESPAPVPEQKPE